MLRLPPEEITRRIDLEDYLAGEQMHSSEAAAAFKTIAARKNA